jgi:hypothetical protein
VTGDRVAVGLADRTADGRGDVESVGSVAEGHESALEWVFVDGA